MTRGDQQPLVRGGRSRRVVRGARAQPAEPSPARARRSPGSACRPREGARDPPAVTVMSSRSSTVAPTISRPSAPRQHVDALAGDDSLADRLCAGSRAGAGSPPSPGAPAGSQPASAPDPRPAAGRHHHAARRRCSRSAVSSAPARPTARSARTTSGSGVNVDAARLQCREECRHPPPRIHAGLAGHVRAAARTAVASPGSRSRHSRPRSHSDSSPRSRWNSCLRRSSSVSSRSNVTCSAPRGAKPISSSASALELSREGGPAPQRVEVEGEAPPRPTTPPRPAQACRRRHRSRRLRAGRVRARRPARRAQPRATPRRGRSRRRRRRLRRIRCSGRSSLPGDGVRSNLPAPALPGSGSDGRRRFSRPLSPWWAPVAFPS